MSFTSKPLHQPHKMRETKTKTKTKTKTTFITTSKASQFRMMNQLEVGGGRIITNNGPGCGHESSSFRVLYYGDASAGSIPFMWESHPGTPKHATTEPSTPPPLTPPPAFHHQNNEKYNNSPKQSLRDLFRTTSARKSHVAVSSSDSSISYDSSKQSTSLRSLFLASSSSTKVHMPSSFSLPSTPGTTFGMEDNGGGGGGDGSPTSTLCFGGGGGFMKVYRRKKVKSVTGSHGMTQKKKFISF